jgi:hypothetical protein
VQLQVPPSSHFIFIPVVLVLGIVLGFMLGARATREAIALDDRRKAEREARRAARAAAKTTEAPPDAPDAPYAPG